MTPPLPKALRDALREALQTEITSAKLLTGGMINRAARVTVRSEGAAESIFVKWKEDAPADFFAREADGLERLRTVGALRVPQVLACKDNPRPPHVSLNPMERTLWGTPSFLALEYIPEALPSQPARFAQSFGEGLAALHRQGVSPTGEYGLETDNFIGALPQSNRFHARWADFYREERILPLIERARARNLLSLERERALMELLERFDTLLDPLSDSPTLLHGDLWSGNFLAAGDEAVLIDPSIYYAPREMEIAYIELFGGFPEGFLAAYRAAYPLDAGYVSRRPLHQLYPLLSHFLHFGELYGPQVDAVCRHYLR